MAFDRLLIAYLSRFQPRPLFAELVKEFGCPAKGPGLNNPPTLPVQRIGHQKTRGVGQIRSLLDHDNAFPAIAFEPHRLGEDPKRLLLPVATAHLHPPKTLRMLAAQFGTYLINPSPLGFPENMPRTFQFTHPMFALTLDQSGQLQGQYSIIKGIV